MRIDAIRLSLAAGLCLAASGLHANEPLKIGILNDKSSLYADLTGTGSVTAARLAVQDFGGTVNGRSIEIVTADHQNKPDIGANIARTWVATQNIKAIFDVPTSSVAFAVQEIARETKVPLILSGAAASDLTGKACAATSIHWTYDTFALSSGTAKGVVRSGGRKWYFLTQDNAFGTALQRDMTRFVTGSGGVVLGAVRHPLNTSDFASFLVRAEAEKPDVVALANAGSDFTNAIKQAGEFGLTSKGIKMVGLSVTINDIHSLGLATSQGVQFVTPFYWDMTPETRAWSRRFQEIEKKMPNHIQAGVYGSVMHYLAAVKAAGSDDGPTVVAQMKKMPINDLFTKNGRIREDGRVLREFHFMEVKSPKESKGPWDYFKLIETISAEDTAKPLSESECPLIK